MSEDYKTPSVISTYDQARTGFYNTGALTRVETTGGSDGIPTATEFDYDLMGRVRKHRQYIAGQEYDLEYTYNLAGQLVSEKYPSGRIVTNSYDANGRLSGITDASRTYLSGLQYQGKGNSLSQMSFGNTTTETFALNDRLQMINQTLTKGSDVLEKYDYGYGQIDGSGNLDSTKNNGQLGKIESYIGTAKQWTQKFQYDSIGRLANAEERRGDTNALSFKQRFDYDRFGNMYRILANNPTGQETPLPTTWIENADISKSTNQITANTTYDDAGNVTTDNKFRTMGFSYDANGRMIKATKTNIPDALLVYDASGQRVAEKVNDIWRFLIYDTSGKLVAEYGGLQATDDGGVKYLLSDWQGSTRCIVSNSSFVQVRNDYTAFGEEIQAGTGLRTTTQGFSSTNNVRQKYGLTERDEAIGMDHALFRKHENRAGRWTGPDPYNGSMGIGNPQSFNRYSYVTNEPTNFIDPSGLNMASPGSSCTINITYTDDNGEHHISLPGTLDRYGNCHNFNPGTVQVYGGGWDFFPIAGGGQVYNPFDRGPDIGGGGGGGDFGDRGPTPLSITNACITAAGTVATGAERSHVADGMWQGANGKWYRLGWGGNGATKGRSLATSAAGKAQIAGRVLFGATVVIDIAQVSNGETSPNEAGYDMLMAGASAFGGVPGMFICNSHDLI